MRGLYRCRGQTTDTDEVTIARNGEEAIIQYADPRIWATHFRLGPEVQRMTDREILDQWNACLRVQEQVRAAGPSRPG